MGLNNTLYIFRRDLASTINRIDRLREGFAVLRTFESLISFARADRVYALSDGHSMDIA